MSTRATIILTTDNEHWHHELCAKYNYGLETKGDDCFVLEFDNRHIIEHDEDGLMVVVDPSTPLGQALKTMRINEGEEK